MSRPIVVDIDGTMSRRDRSIDGRVFDALRAWAAPVVIATGKAFPYPVALSDFIGIETRVIAENGGVVFAEDQVRYNADDDATSRFVSDLRGAGYDLGWGRVDLANRWRETEVAISRQVPRQVVDEIASRHGLDVIDSGFAYHAKSPDVSKGEGLETVADLLALDPQDFVAIGDSENDVPTFAVAGEAYAVSNADERALAAADHVTDGAYADGLLEVLSELAESP